MKDEEKNVNDENQVIRNYNNNYDNNYNKNSNNVNQLLVIGFIILIIVTTVASKGILFFVHLTLLFVLKESVNKDNAVIQAYKKACKIAGIILLVILISFGACFGTAMLEGLLI